jgi:hypothetical protein
MASKVAGVVLTALVLLSASVAFATPKDRENIEIQVVSSKTKTRGSSLDKIFTYTDVIYTMVGSQKVAFECEQKNYVCPIMENGKTYSAERDGDTVYITMTAPGDKKPFPVKYGLIGPW